MNDLLVGIENCVMHISKWNITVFGNMNNQISSKKSQLNDLMSKPRLDDNAITMCRKELAELTHKKELMWKQMAKTHYLK